MAGLFGDLSNEGHEEVQDRLGGFVPLDTDIYTGDIKVAYATKSDGGARGVVFLIDLAGREYRETFWVTNKKGENFFYNKDDKSKKVSLPGFVVMNDICLVTDGKPLSEQEAEEKIVNVYDPESKSEKPKAVQVLTGLTGKTVSLGIVRQIENKTKLEGTEYVATSETREINTVAKVFHTESKRTVAEATRGSENAEFWDKWLERNKGNTQDRRTIKDGDTKSGRPGSPPKQGEKRETKSLFG